MANTAYSGALLRSAHFAFRPPVPGVSADHGPGPDQQIEQDPFQPVPPTAGQVVDGADGTNVWQPQDDTPMSQMLVGDRPHWTQLQDAVPSNVHPWESEQAATERMLANHSIDDYRPNTYIPYKVATQGQSIEYTVGRSPFEAGENAPEDLQYLVAGKNAYDFTNQPNEVYGGDQTYGVHDPANVGRYRLGTNENQFGLYEFWTKQGQDAELRAYTGQHPWMPVDKPPVSNPAPYTAPSSGTTTWTMPSFQVPSIFSLPSETSITDYGAQNEWDAEVSDSGNGFEDGGRL